MERADLLYSGLMFAAGLLSLWTALLLTAAFVALAPSSRKIRIYRCYNFIYKRSRSGRSCFYRSCSYRSWCRRDYARSFRI